MAVDDFLVGRVETANATEIGAAEVLRDRHRHRQGRHRSVVRVQLAVAQKRLIRRLVVVRTNRRANAGSAARSGDTARRVTEDTREVPAAAEAVVHGVQQRRARSGVTVAVGARAWCCQNARRRRDLRMDVSVGGPAVDVPQAGVAARARAQGRRVSQQTRQSRPLHRQGDQAGVDAAVDRTEELQVRRRRGLRSSTGNVPETRMSIRPLLFFG